MKKTIQIFLNVFAVSFVLTLFVSVSAFATHFIQDLETFEVYFKLPHGAPVKLDPVILPFLQTKAHYSPEEMYLRAELQQVFHSIQVQTSSPPRFRINIRGLKPLKFDKPLTMSGSNSEKFLLDLFQMTSN